MLKQIDHLGIAVYSLDEACRFYENVLGFRCAGVEVVASQKVRVAFFQIGEVKLELLEPTDPESPIAAFLNKRGEGIHHVAYLTDNIDEQLKQAKQSGAALIHKTPIPGTEKKQIAFLHPSSCHGVLTELCEKINES